MSDDPRTGTEVVPASPSMWKALCRTVVLSSATVAMAVGATQAAPAAPAGEPVAVLVTGQTITALQTEQSAVQNYQPMKARLEQDGWQVQILNAPGGDMRADAALIGDAVRRAGSGPVALIAHSASTLSGRYYLKELGGNEHVATYVAMGSAQYGSPGGCLQLPGAGWDTCPASDFIAELNAGDDTPGDTEYVSIMDDMADGRLDGGQCRMPAIPGIAHATMTADPRVIDAVVAAVDGACPGSFVDEPDGSIRLLDTLFPTLR